MKFKSALLAAALILPLGSTLILDLVSDQAAQARPNRANGSEDTTLMAQGGPGGPGGHGGHGGGRWGGMEEGGPRLDKMKQELGLSDAQVQQIKAIHESSKTQSQGLRDQIKAAHDQMQKLMVSGASEAQLRQQHQTLQNLMQQMGNQRFETQMKVRNVLTPAQQAKLAQLKEQRMEGRGDRQGRRGGRGPAGQGAQ